MRGQFETGSSSAETHRLTQPSNTLNRRYVNRPTNLAIEEAARMADYLDEHNTNTPARPSRLVNLRVHNDDLESLRAAAAEEARKVAEKKEIKEKQKVATRMAQPIIAHKVVELGGGALPPAPEPKVDRDESIVETSATQLVIADELDEVAEDDHSININAEPEAVIDDISDEDLQAIELDDVSEAAGSIEPARSSMPESVFESEVQSRPEPTPVKNADLDTRALAMSIAADYTAASLGATMANLPTEIDEVDTNDLNTAVAEVQAADSIDQIANTVAGYVNKIRSSEDPEEISLAIKDLKNYAEAIKQNSSLPEIAELGDTIEKFIDVTEKSTGIKAVEDSQKTIVRARTSEKKSSSAKASGISIRSKGAISITKPNPAKSQALVAARAIKANRTTKPGTVSINTRGRQGVRSSNAIPAKLRNPSGTKKLNDDEVLRKTMRKVAKLDETEKPTKHIKQKSVRKKGGVKRFVLAFGCAAACVAGIIYVVSANVPDISVRVAAMQAGVDSSYPSYVPTEFSLAGIESNDKEIILKFTNANEQSFTLSEKKSAWDSAALERNLVKKTWQDDYSTTHEQGITMYIHQSSAAWVNGGVLYQITAEDDVLTKKQLRSIATSMQ